MKEVLISALFLAIAAVLACATDEVQTWLQLRRMRKVLGVSAHNHH